jgi:hypothetical protein
MRICRNKTVLSTDIIGRFCGIQQKSRISSGQRIVRAQKFGSLHGLRQGEKARRPRADAVIVFLVFSGELFQLGFDAAAACASRRFIRNRARSDALGDVKRLSACLRQHIAAFAQKRGVENLFCAADTDVFGRRPDALVNGLNQSDKVLTAPDMARQFLLGAGENFVGSLFVTQKQLFFFREHRTDVLTVCQSTTPPYNVYDCIFRKGFGDMQLENQFFYRKALFAKRPVSCRRFCAVLPRRKLCGVSQ